MSYEQWKNRLFEESFPRLRFEGGSLAWQKNETLSIEWGGRSYILDPGDIYTPDTSPTEAVMQWCWSNLPLSESELPEAFIWWNDSEKSFRAGVIRPHRTVYTQSVVPRSSFIRFGQQMEDDPFAWQLSGGVVTVDSTLRGIPALCPLSHPITFNTVVGEYLTSSEDIVVAFSPYEIQHAFVGHKNIIQRICEEDRGVIGIPSAQWSSDITQALERT